ncbi:solute carrier family 17 member 9-like [Takifugu rubripes]|uniref:Voltage-gated purine nucleotide uniporter SLC17A9 n=1 Tax=Takifugu rubripes TaxID=31033 RepID=H2SEM2_TAKRU|nr:solute carrier family 17 member 9-like [Takifugu rubripes]XP_011601055.2 solute carrier family 17 member 9-like [Takifugu rubripes]
MAANHTSGDGKNTESLLASKVSVAFFPPGDQPADQNLWPRPLLRKWMPMLFLGTCLLYGARMTMPICVVSMSEEFHWSKIDSGLVLGGFFWGYCFTQILGGHASDRIGGERVVCIAAASWGLITAGTPLLANLGSHILALMTFSRFLMGLSQGVFFPSLVSLCSQRVSEGERGLLMSTMHGGCHLGTLLAGGMGSLMLDWYGWESIFYTIGFLSGLWALVVWQFLDGSVITKPTDAVKQPALPLTRLWWRLCKMPPIWAMVFAHMCLTSTSYTLLSWLPTYFKETFPHAKGWVYNTVPWLCAIPLAVGGGYVSDVLINKGYSVIFVRKLMQTLSMGTSSVFVMLLVGPVTCHSAIIYVSAVMGLFSFTSGGVSVNVQDLAPSSAGALYGFMNTMGALMGVLFVSLSGYLIEVTQTWGNVFAVITLINTMGLGIFLIFGDARRVDLEGDSPVQVV